MGWGGDGVGWGGWGWGNIKHVQLKRNRMGWGGVGLGVDNERIFFLKKK